MSLFVVNIKNSSNSLLTVGSPSVTHYSHHTHSHPILNCRERTRLLASYWCTSLKEELLSSRILVLMDSKILFLLSSLLTLSLALEIEPATTANPQITVMGIVYCDICSNNTFSRHSYFLPGVDVKIDCTFKATSPKTIEQIAFSVNRTTNQYGVYKLEIPSVDGIDCARDKAMVSSCRASLMWSSSSSCNVPGHITTSDGIAVKSRRSNLCIYSLNALNYRPSRRDITLCKN
ncbi:hypothetical protein LOK49_LG04G03503 [Camellia lanceoleosa]|uniref:Uncharacterized protein n=1 Tax=Camellia lanceoleosa TaxID=1840588 RepID=A0ACC0I5I4_9ERIC|nr:hypothetical protein LOK49_LG04G03503 [Camellia lanceoleosa]